MDPGTGSMLMQLLLGGIMAVLVLLRSSWERVLGWFSPASHHSVRQGEVTAGHESAAVASAV